MSLSVLGDLNWFAVVVAAIVYFALGGLWFATPVFGKAWQRSVGLDPDNAPPMSLKFYVGPFITCFVATLALAMLDASMTTDTLGQGILLALVVGIGLCGSVLYVTGISESKPTAWILIAGGYHVIGLIVVVIILTIWP